MKMLVQLVCVAVLLACVPQNVNRRSYEDPDEDEEAVAGEDVDVDAAEDNGDDEVSVRAALDG
jgi:hypothetical protein